MVLQGVRISERALSLFMKAAMKLQERGGETDDYDLWSFAINSSHNVKDAVSDSSLESVRCLEAVKDTLYGLLDSCERKLSTVKAAFWPQVSGRGIQDLPDEILSKILEFVVEDDDASGLPQSGRASNHPEMVLTRVSPRFRSLALSTPELWRYIESTMSSNEVAAHLERSKDCSLTIEIGGWKRSEDIQRFLNIVTPHAHRWTSLSYYPVESLEASMKNLELPQLESLRVKSDRFEFLRNWNMPKLCYVRMSALDPRRPPRIPPALGISSAQALRSLNFDEITFSLEVVDYLTSAPNLTELRITTRGTSDLDVLGIHGTLPRVRKMSLRTSDEAALLVLIGHLQMPELSILDLDICYCEVWDMTQIQSLESYPSVHELNISYFNEIENTFYFSENWCCPPRYTMKMELSLLFVLFPEVERLNLLNRCSNFEVTRDVKFPPLLSISAQVCQEDGNFLQYLVDGLQRDSRWEQFEFFQLTNEVENAISWDEASSIFTEEKLWWYK